MIYVAQSDVSEEDFLNFLFETKESTLKELRGNASLSKMEGVQFEDLVYRNACKVSKGTLFEHNLEQTGTFAFPDIIARRYYGIEVKTTNKNKWVSTGNSVLETSRIPGVERVYMFFGKLGGTVDIMYRPYQECLTEVGVTHSPRYIINMELPNGNSIFDKIGIPYEKLRKDKDSIKHIKNYYRSLLSEGEELWWIDQSADEVSPTPIIKPFSNLPFEEKESFMGEAMVLFPEIFGNSSLKFERVAAYLVTSRNAISSNIRDIFTAGGQKSVTVVLKELVMPQIFYKMYQFATDIRDYLSKTEVDFLNNYWKTDWTENYPVEEWKQRIDFYSTSQLAEYGITASQIFEAGIKADAKEVL